MEDQHPEMCYRPLGEIVTGQLHTHDAAAMRYIGYFLHPGLFPDCDVLLPPLVVLQIVFFYHT